MADKLASTKWGMRLMKGLAWAVRGSVNAGLDLRTSVRQAAVADHPMPTKLIPTTSLVGYKLSLGSLLAPTIYYMKKVLGLRSDGLVPHQFAHIDGSDIAYANYDHGAGAFFGNSDRMMLGLVGHVLEQPQQMLLSK